MTSGLTTEQHEQMRQLYGQPPQHDAHVRAWRQRQDGLQLLRETVHMSDGDLDRLRRSGAISGEEFFLLGLMRSLARERTGNG